MKLLTAILLPLLAASVSAIIPDTQVSLHDKAGYPSLPNLLAVEKLQDLEKEWQPKGHLELDAGRLVINEQSGALWSASTLVNSKDEWTLELVFRNSEKIDVDDHSFYDTNGFSFWIVQPSATDMNDMLNFGGPAKFDGFQFLVNNKEKSGIKIFANDGTKQVPNTLESAVGSCAVNYLDLMVPFLLRVSYSKSKKWFKVQIDNNLCFKTDALTFDKLSEDFKFGASASVHPDSKEYWEILKLDVFGTLTEDAIDDHGIISDGSIKVVTMTKAELAPTVEPSYNRESLLERSRKLREQFEREAAQAAAPDSNIDLSLAQIGSRLSQLETLVGNLDSKDVISAIQDIKHIQARQMKVLEELLTTYGAFESLISALYREISQSAQNLHERVISEIRDHQSDVIDINKKVDLLMANHKEIQLQYSQGAEVQPDFSALVSSMVKWVLLPIVLGIIVLTVFVHRLRKDIKHSKLL